MGYVVYASVDFSYIISSFELDTLLASHAHRLGGETACSTSCCHFPNDGGKCNSTESLFQTTFFVMLVK